MWKNCIKIEKKKKQTKLKQCLEVRAHNGTIRETGAQIQELNSSGSTQKTSTFAETKSHSNNKFSQLRGTRNVRSMAGPE